MPPSFSVSSKDIYTGIWINWSKGRTLGATLTLNNRDGTFLVIAIALFVTYVSDRVWRISCFIFHSLASSSSEKDADGLHQQTQVVLRNASNPTDALWTWLQMSWTWRQLTSSRRRMLPFILYALFTIVWTAVAAILSSMFASMSGQEVILSGENCSWLNYTAPMDIAAPYSSQAAMSSINYAQNCYTDDAESGDCKSYVTTQLSFLADRNATCPFEEGICKHKDQNLLMDTGYMNSHFDLGLNTPPERRFELREVQHCAPLTISDRKEIVNVTINGAVLPYVRYYFGPAYENNYTFQVPIKYDQFDLETAYPDYTVIDVEAYYKDGVISHQYNDALWTPDPLLQPTNGNSDVTLYLISAQGIWYTSEVNDDVYSAHNSTYYKDTQYFTADEPASIIGCKSQLQFCLPTSSLQRYCGPLSSTSDFRTSINASNVPDEKTLALINTFLPTAESSALSLSTIAWLMGSYALQAKTSLYGRQSGPLPDNQWQLDMENWYSITQSANQLSSVRVATGPSNTNWNEALIRPSTEEQHYICKNQKVQSAAFSNFSVFGLAFTFSLGVVIAVISYTMESLSRLFRRKLNKDGYSLIEWKTNQLLQLHRLANEGYGHGNWSKCLGDVPITKKDEDLGTLDLERMDHPVLNSIGFPKIPEKKRPIFEHAKFAFEVTYTEYP